MQWFALSPLLVLVGAAILLLLAGALTPQWPRGLYAGVTAAAAIAAGVLAIIQWDDISDGSTSTLVGGALAFDTFAMFVTIVICAAVVGVALVAGDHLHRDGGDGPEIYALVLVAAAGGVVMGAGQRPDRPVPRARDDVAGASTCWPPATGAARRARRAG